jgi:hypothetical protein
MLPGDETRFVQARNGDHLITPFQCDLCHFRNVYKRDPSGRKGSDLLALRCIRRANLDALWAREPGTVAGNLSGAKRLHDIGTGILEIPGITPPMGPFALQDKFGMGIAMTMLLRSLDAGKNERTIQYSTMRRLRSAYSNIYNASSSLSNVAVMAQETRKVFSTDCPTYGYWFERFMKGCHKRMGDEVNSDYALSLDIVLELLKRLERDWRLAKTLDAQWQVCRFACFLVIGYCKALRGEEIVKTKIGGMRKYFEQARSHPLYPHCIVPLLGRFKGETGERCHLMVLAYDTKSGIACGTWIERMLMVTKEQGRTGGGYLFLESNGRPSRCGDFESELIERLIEVRDERQDLFEIGLNVAEAYGVSRSFRRGSTTEAQNRGVPPSVIDINNRWRKVERAGGRAPSMSMREHYTEIRMAIKQLWVYSRSL